MRSLAHPRRTALALLAAGLLVSAPAAADWMVTRDGGRFEIKGTWKVDGKRVVFTLPNGTLSSLRLADVDLEASRKATTAALEAAAEAERPQPPPPPRKVRVLTDKDFARAEPPAGEANPAPATPGEQPSTATPAPEALSPVQVMDWKQQARPGSKEMEISGVVRNTGPEVATAVSLTVRLFDEQGTLLALDEASLTTRALQPGQTTSFQVVFPDVISFGSARFEIRSVPLLVRPRPAEEEVPSPDGGSAP